ncbi:MAG: hypothetical protein LBU85_13095 [Treponema sp.]|jgi:hypothetical protein|nr:hypothetical protein [Treponema sp.]
MQFSNFIWNNFKESNKGKKFLNFFSGYQFNIENKNNIDFYREILANINYKKVNIDDEMIKAYYDDILNFSIEFPKELIDNNIKTNINSFEEFEVIFDFLIHLVPDEKKEKDNPKWIFGVDDIPYLSECLFFLYPEYCFPYYFVRLYHIVISIFNEFGIFIPPPPPKGDRDNRMFHYIDLCKSLYNFRKSFGIDKYELPAFIYGFATEVVKKYEIDDNLPEPRKAYFIGGGKKDKAVDSSGDFDYLDKADSTTIASWNGNPETQPGDIIVMYCLSPRSYIHSIWRAVAPGSYDPFFYFYKTIYIGRPIFVKPISIDELKKNEILSEMPLVKGNMQGINGRIIEKKYYDKILELLNKKGFDINILPKLHNNTIQDIELLNERDVEKYLLEPLLQKLGYNKNNWKRQLKLRMGRDDRVFPDYVIFPKDERNNESGYWIWEAKYSISNNKQLKEDFGQAKSYALRLNCKGFGLISKEGIWLSESNYIFEKLKYWSWKQIQENDYFNEIFDIAGNKKHN